MPNTQPYGTIVELKARIDKQRSDDDTVLTALILGASRAVDQICNRPDGFLTTTASARIYVGSGLQVQRIDECTRVTAVAVKASITDTAYTAWSASDYILFSGDKRNPEFNNPPYDQLMVAITGDQAVFTSGTLSGRGRRDDFFAPGRNLPARLRHNPRAAHGQPTVQVTAFWGYADTVPPNIKEATLMTCARFYKRYESSMADVIADDGLGALLYRQALDPDVKNLLVMGRYIRPTVGRK